MKVSDLNGKAICILGYGREGQAMEQALKADAPDATVTVRDQKDGPDYLKNLGVFDVIIKSPGVPHSEVPESVQNRITNSTQIFLDTVMKKGSLVIGITGTKGKSTTASLIYEILKIDGRDVNLVGNIGEAAIKHVRSAKLNKIFVLEMSSYQLEDRRQDPKWPTVSPHIAVITSFYPEHLDHHGSEDEYKRAKQEIVFHQTSQDHVFFNRYSSSVALPGSGQKHDVNNEGLPLDTAEISLKGIHNLQNIQLACAVARHIGVPDKNIAAAIRRFIPLPHRMQSLGIHGGIAWIDDSISTIPESTIAAMETFKSDIGTLIVGGQDRGLNFENLGRDIANSGIQNVILFPESGARIKAAIEKHERKPNFYEAKNMEEAVTWAKKNTPKGKICLLSPASPSYGMFRNFEERGERFRTAINGD